MFRNIHSHHQSGVSRPSLALVATLQCALCLIALPACGQSGTSTQTAPAPQTSPATQSNPSQNTPPPPKGKVLFERHETTPDDSTDVQPSAPSSATPARGATGVSSSNPKTLRRRAPQAAASSDDTGTPETPPAVPVPAAGGGMPQSSSSADDETEPTREPLVLTEADAEAAKRISEADRAAVQITATDLDLHLNTHTGATETRARLTLHNTGSQPLKQLPLRVSGALHWEAARLTTSSASLPLEQHRLPDELDHTGLANELVLTLPQPLAPGGTVQADLYYGGTLGTSAQRLLALGAPAGRAELTDWDTVSDTFTGLRGLGNVLWYPVAGPTAMLGENADVLQAVETSRARNTDSSFRLRLTVEYAGSRPDAAFFCSERAPLEPITPDAKAGNDGGVVTATWTRSTLEGHTPSLFIASGAPQAVAGGLLHVVTDRADTAAALGDAAARLRPMMSEWLGARPARSLEVLDLPIPSAAGFSDGSLLVAPLTTGPAEVLAPSLVQPLATAWLPAGISSPWLREGIPTFLQAVWAERTSGRAAALAGLAATSASLKAAAEPQQRNASSSVSSSSQEPEAPVDLASPLVTCTDPACTRGKAAYVLEMLRNTLGDDGLQQALSGWRIKMEQSPASSAAAETTALEALLQQVAGKRDLSWFFRNWIDAEHGLPELSILTVAPRRVERNAPTNYLPEQRKPVAGPVGAEPVPLPGDPDDEARRKTVTPGNRVAPVAGSWMVAVEVQNAGSADVEVPVTVRSGNLTNTLPLRVAAHSQATIRVPFEAEPQEVFVNDGSIPEVRTTQHRRSIANLPAAQ